MHVLDAAMICGDDLRRWPYAERRRRAELLVLVQPTSACVGRVFSLLKHYFGDQQYRALADVIRTSLMLAVNKRAV